MDEHNSRNRVPKPKLGERPDVETAPGDVIVADNMDWAQPGFNISMQLSRSLL